MPGKPVIFVTGRNGTSQESDCKHAGIALHPGLPRPEQGRRAQDEPHTHPTGCQSGQPRLNGAKDTAPSHLHSPMDAPQSWPGEGTSSTVPSCPGILWPRAGVTLRAPQVGSDTWVGDPDPLRGSCYSPHPS